MGWRIGRRRRGGRGLGVDCGQRKNGKKNSGARLVRGDDITSIGRDIAMICLHRREALRLGKVPPSPWKGFQRRVVLRRSQSLQNQLYRLLRATLRRHRQRVRRHFQRRELAIQQPRIHIVIGALGTAARRCVRGRPGAGRIYIHLAEYPPKACRDKPASAPNTREYRSRPADASRVILHAMRQAKARGPRH